MKCLRTKILFGAVFLLCAASVFAQEDGSASSSSSSAAAPVAAPQTPSLPLVNTEDDSLKIRGYFVGSFSYNSRIQMLPEFAGGAQALTPAKQTNFRFDKFGISAYKFLTPWLSANGAIEAERHRDAHSHGFAPGFGCPGTAPCIERFGAEVPATEITLDRFAITGRIPIGNGLYVSVGRTDTAFGIEKHDEPLNVTATTSETFQFGRPQRMTGAQFTYNFSPNFDINGWWVNRWESETTHTPFDDNNRGKSFGGRLGITPFPRAKLLNFGIGSFYGPERDNNDKDKRQIVDFDFVAAPTAGFFVAGEVLYGQEDNVSFRRRGSPFPQPAAVGIKAKWWTGYTVLHGDVVEWMGLNFRHGWVKDNDGYRTGVQQVLQSITTGPVFHLSRLAPDLGHTGSPYGRTRHPINWIDLKVEYRYNFSDHNIFSATLPSVDITDAIKNSHQLQLQLVVNF